MNSDHTADYHRQRLQDGADCLAAALDYLQRGWSVLSLCTPNHVGMDYVVPGHTKNCDNMGKRPWHRWQDFQDRLPTEAEVRGWWRRLPSANVGLALGPVSGLVRIDVDGVVAEQFLQEISQGDLPPTWEFRSGRQDGTGRGILYRIPPGVTFRTTGIFMKDGELRFQAKGAQTVVPPSRHPDGGRYEWLPGHSPQDIDAALAPAWAVARWSVGINGHTDRPRAAVLGDEERITEPGRNTKLTSLAGTMRRRGMSQTAIEAALLAENAERCDPPMDENEVKGIARKIMRYQPADDVLASITRSGVIPDPTTPQTAYDIILAWFAEHYQPTFRRGDAIYSKSKPGLVTQREACLAPPKALVERLLQAIDCPRDENGPKRNAVPRLFKTWAASAWLDFWASLQPEAETAEIVDDAAGEFWRKVAACLHTETRFAETIKAKNCKDEEVRQERRSLAHWCHRWAKPGPWQPIRSKQLWTRLDGQGQLHIALRVDLFGQQGPHEFSSLSQDQFADLCELYGVGHRQKAGGSRAIVLTAEFIDGLFITPEMEDETP